MSRLHEQLSLPIVPPPNNQGPVTKPARAKPAPAAPAAPPPLELPLDLPAAPAPGNQAAPVAEAPAAPAAPAATPPPPAEVAPSPVPKREPVVARQPVTSPAPITPASVTTPGARKAPAARPAPVTEPRAEPAVQHPVARKPAPLLKDPPSPPAAAPAPRADQRVGVKVAAAVVLLACGALLFAAVQRILQSRSAMPAEAVRAPAVSPPNATTEPIEPEVADEIPPVQPVEPEPTAAENKAEEADMVTAPSTPVSAPAALVMPWIDLRVEGARIARSDHALVITFDNGIFAKVDQLKPEASYALKDLARQLAPYSERVSLLVTGYTDNEPVPKNRPYKTNYDLGMLRALAAANHLIENAGLPRSMISTRSLGDQDAPYPNDTPENRAKNRTVVITVRM